jgi:hypothetical protein
VSSFTKHATGEYYLYEVAAMLQLFCQTHTSLYLMGYEMLWLVLAPDQQQAFVILLLFLLLFPLVKDGASSTVRTRHHTSSRDQLSTAGGSSTSTR